MIVSAAPRPNASIRYRRRLPRDGRGLSCSLSFVPNGDGTIVPPAPAVNAAISEAGTRLDEPETRTSSPGRAEPAAAPAWAGAATRPDEVPHCPLCDYDLRGLAEPRCPECGYRFTWEELRDP